MQFESIFKILQSYINSSLYFYDKLGLQNYLYKINNAWKGASEEMYKAQANNQKESKNESKGQNQKNDKDKPGKDDVQDVDFEEVKD